MLVGGFGTSVREVWLTPLYTRRKISAKVEEQEEEEGGEGGGGGKLGRKTQAPEKKGWPTRRGWSNQRRLRLVRCAAHLHQPLLPLPHENPHLILPRVRVTIPPALLPSSCLSFLLLLLLSRWFLLWFPPPSPFNSSTSIRLSLLLGEPGVTVETLSIPSTRRLRRRPPLSSLLLRLSSLSSLRTTPAPLRRCPRHRHPETEREKRWRLRENERARYRTREIFARSQQHERRLLPGLPHERSRPGRARGVVSLDYYGIFASRAQKSKAPQKAPSPTGTRSLKTSQSS